MNYIELSLMIIWILYTNAFDPDKDICENTILDSSVYSTDGQTYISKGDYYWKTKKLDSANGIKGNGDLIANKFAEIDEPIIASFTLRQHNNLTVFVCPNKWIGYTGTGKVLKGTTEKWPQFKDITLNTMFSTDLSKNEIFVIFDDSKQFFIYDFSHLSEPKLKGSGFTEVIEYFLWFIDEKSKTTEEERPKKTLKDLLNVKTSITYEQTLILMSDQHYCKVKLNAGDYEKKCQPEKDIIYYLLCPIEMEGTTSAKPRPTESIESITNDPHSSPVTNSDGVTVVSSGSTQSSIGSSTTALTTAKNNSFPEEFESEADKDKKSNLVVVVIIALIVVIIIVVIIGSIILWIKNKSQTNRISRKKTQRFSKKSIGSIQTVNSDTGQLIGSSQTSSGTSAANKSK